MQESCEIIRFTNEEILYEFINVTRTLENFVDKFEKNLTHPFILSRGNF